MSVVADKLREARALIERGWCQGSYGCERIGLYCANGAIAKTLGFDADADMIPDLNPFPEVPTLAAAIGGETSRDITNWNDDPERTQAEVLAAFDKAIALAEEQSA